MYNKAIALATIFMLLSCFCWSQQKQDSIQTLPYSRLDIGLSVGYEGGGITGIKVTVHPIRNNNTVQMFFGYSYLGQNAPNAGYNGGVKIFPLKLKYSHASPFMFASYGTHSYVNITNATYLNKSFEGFSIGAGFNIYSRQKGNLFSFLNNSKFWQRLYASYSIEVPLSNNGLSDYRNYLNTAYGITTKKAWPVNFSIGVNYRLL